MQCDATARQVVNNGIGDTRGSTTAYLIALRVYFRSSCNLDGQRRRLTRGRSRRPGRVTIVPLAEEEKEEEIVGRDDDR